MAIKGPYDWFYFNDGQKQHIVRLADLTATPMQSAVCGKGVLALLPASVRWQKQPEGPAAREKCKQCLAILEREANVQRG
jgi:hypothetical protein